MQSNPPPPGAADQRVWHMLEAPAALDAVGTVADGLSEAEARARLQRDGPNRIPQRRPTPGYLIFGRQFANPLIYALALAAGVSLLIGHVNDSIFIGIVLLINALIGGVEEYRAQRSAQALQDLLRSRAMVIRDGDTREIDAEHAVIGDIVQLESGFRVPADLRLLWAHSLQIDESLLTGESLAVEKDPGWAGEAAAGVGDRLNMAYAGSLVARGRARGVVIATGGRTEVGRLAADLGSATSGEPPLLIRLRKFTRAIGFIALGASFVVAVGGVLLHGYGWTEMFMFAVALAVSAIPQGLPVTITVALAIAAKRMARRRVIVGRLGAVEGLGSCTLIASDKTGTLTRNELTVREARFADGARVEFAGVGYEPAGRASIDGRGARADEDERLAELCRIAALCNEGDLHQDESGAWRWAGDPTDIALISMSHKAGVHRRALLEQLPQVGAIPFEPEHRYAATFHETDEGVLVLVKGAPERVLAMCGIGEGETARLLGIAQEMAESGLRMLALAAGSARGATGGIFDAGDPPEGLRFAGFVGMIDPLREGVLEAVAACRSAGIRVAMVTGDHPVTALAISRELGLAEEDSQVVTGDEVSALSRPQLIERARAARVFARVAPHQKLDIVRAAQAGGDFVAVTGDGVNDAPALRAANIGVAMGRSGTDVAREAADLIITDDNFATIVGGVEEGRIAYDNIRKVTLLLVSTGGAEVTLVALAVATGSPLPLLPVQLLWLNIVTNGIQDKAIAFEPGEGDVLKRRPRPPSQPVFDRIMLINTAFNALVLGVTGFIAFRWMLARGWELEEARNALLLLIVLFENVLLGNVRSESKAALHMSPLKSPLLAVGAALALGVHAAAMHTTLGQRVLGVAPVSPRTWAGLAALALGVFVIIEMQKFVRRRVGIV
jgi:P-type Ca2+ transporter type 2C